MKPLRACVMAAVALCFALGWGLTQDAQDASQTIPPTIPTKDFTEATACEVTRVFGGDTVVLSIDGGEITYCLAGVDTPDVAQQLGAEPAEPYGQEASQFTTNLLQGESVYLEEATTGVPGQLPLAHLYRVPDGLFVNLEVVRQGYGRVYVERPSRYLELFRFYEQRAREAQKGLWTPEASGLEQTIQINAQASAIGQQMLLLAEVFGIQYTLSEGIADTPVTCSVNGTIGQVVQALAAAGGLEARKVGDVWQLTGTPYEKPAEEVSQPRRNDRQIFYELVWLEDRMDMEAAREYICNKYQITRSQLLQIMIRGGGENWPMPPYAGP